MVGEKGLDILVNNAGAHSSTDGGISNILMSLQEQCDIFRG